MTILAKDQKDLKEEQEQKKKQFEKEIRDEYLHIQLEADFLRKEVETCYKQLHTLQSSSTEQLLISQN